MKRFILFILITSFGFCEEKNSSEKEKTFAYNIPGRIDVQGSWDFLASASFIYWQPMEEGLDFALTHPSNHTTEIAKIIYEDFNYKPGFQVALGMDFNYDDWIIIAEYTRLHAKEHHKYSSGNVVPFWQDTVSSASSAEGKWSIKYDIIDLHLGRPYYVGVKLIFKPIFGFRGGLINQNFKAEYQDTEHSQLMVYPKAKEHSWLIGPRVGVTSDFLFGKDFVLFGKTAYGIYYQDFKKVTYQTTSTGTIGSLASTFHSHTDQLTPSLEFGLGLGWETYFSEDSWHFDFRLSYDFQIFWNQNHMRRLKDKSNLTETTESAIGNLMFHGLTVSARIDF